MGWTLSKFALDACSTHNDRNKAETLPSTVLYAVSEADGNWAPLIFEESISKRTKASLCTVKDGLIAAQTAARILKTQLREGTINRC